MTLKEAIESGRPFKRKDWPEYYRPFEVDRIYSHDDVVSDDYLLKEETVNITAHQLLDALNKSIKYQSSFLPEQLSILIKDLGFKEDL